MSRIRQNSSGISINLWIVQSFHTACGMRSMVSLQTMQTGAASTCCRQVLRRYAKCSGCFTKPPTSVPSVPHGEWLRISYLLADLKLAILPCITSEKRKTKQLFTHKSCRLKHFPSSADQAPKLVRSNHFGKLNDLNVFSRYAASAHLSLRSGSLSRREHS